MRVYSCTNEFKFKVKFPKKISRVESICSRFWSLRLKRGQNPRIDASCSEARSRRRSFLGGFQYGIDLSKIPENVLHIAPSICSSVSLKLVSAATISLLYLLTVQEAAAAMHSVFSSSSSGHFVYNLAFDSDGIEHELFPTSVIEDDDLELEINSIPSETDFSSRFSDEVLELYSLRSQSQPVGQSAGAPRSKEENFKEPVAELTEELKKGCGGPQCVAVLLRPSATLEGTFFVGLIAMGLVAQRRGETAKKLKELVSAGEEQRRKSEEMMRKLQQQLQVQEGLILDLLQGKSNPEKGQTSLTENSSEAQGIKAKQRPQQIKVRESVLSEHAIKEVLLLDKLTQGSSSLDSKTLTGREDPSAEQGKMVDGKKETVGGKVWLKRQAESLEAGKIVGEPSQNISLPLDLVYGRVQESAERTTYFSGSESGSESDWNSEPTSSQQLALKAPNPKSRKPRNPKLSNHSQESGSKESPRRAPTSWAPRPQLPPHHGQVAAPRVYLGLVVVPDTNCYLRNMRYVRLLRKLPLIHTVVPLAVLGELDGLQQNGDPKTSFAARKAVRFFSSEVSMGGSWLRGQKQSEVPSRRSSALRDKQHLPSDEASTHVGSTGTPASWQKQWKQNSGGKLADDEIIDCCLYFAEQGNSVVLLTDDKAMQVKALFHEVEACSLKQFLEDNLTSGNTRHLK